MRKMLLLQMILILLAVQPSVVPADISNASRSDMTFLSEYVQTLYDEESVIPVGQVKSAIETADGYLWFAGYQGLMRYSGMDTKLFEREDGFPSYNVNILFEDSMDRLWIGTNDSGIVLYDKNNFIVYGIEEGLSSASVRGISEDENGNIYVTTTNGIASISPDGTLAAHPALNNVFATHIEYMGGGRFICMLSDGEIVSFNKTEILQIYESDYLGGAQPLSLFLSKSGALYVGTVENIVYITDSDLSSNKKLIIPSRQTLNQFYEDSMGRIWICADDGLGYLSDERFTAVDGLEMSNSIECVYEDYEGNYWVGSSRQGLLQLTRGKFTNISFMAGLPDYTVNTTAVFGGDLYIGADEGLVILRNNEQVHNELSEMLKDVRIRCMLTDSKGRLWICTYENYGVVLVKPDGSIRLINADNGLASNMVRCIIEAKNGDMLVGMSGGISVIRNEQVIGGYKRDDGLANDVILSLAEGPDGIIYAGSDGGGLYEISSDGKISAFIEKDGLPSGIILRVTAINDGLWLSTGNSICYMDENGIQLIDKLAAYKDNVFDIKQIGGDIWFLNSKGVNICEIENLLSEDELVITQILKRDGLYAPITANSWNALTDDGIIYVSTGKGVLSVDTKNSTDNAVVPFAAVSEVLADGEQADMNGGIEGEISISRHVQRVDIHLALLSYASKDGTVSYMLEGFDDEPITVPRSEYSWISYTNLKGGKYKFTLYGTNAAGIQSETVTLIIRKEFTLFEMPFTRVVLAFAALSALILCVRGFISHRTKVFIRQRQEYKEISGQIMTVAANLADSRNEYTRGHSRRVAEYAKIIGKRLGMSESELETLYYSALLHDIGKTGISDVILNKNGPLTNEEFEIIKTHVTIGGELLKEVTVIEDVALGAKYHHERVDGKGYADGLTGDEIPVAAKIISVCNAFDSMLSDRPYRKAMSVESIQSELIHNAGTQFDEKVTAILISLIHEGSVPL